MSLGLALAIALAQPAAAICIVQPINRLVKSSDDVWWGTVTEATAAPAGSPGIWELTVRLDQVLKGEGAPGNTYTVYTSTCGLYLSKHAVERAAPGFVGDQRLFFVHLDQQNRFVAYSEIVKVPNAGPSASTEEQYAAALTRLGLTRDATSPSPPPEGSPPSTKGADDSVTPILLMAAAMGVVAVVIAAVVLYNTRRRPEVS
jgi:hypothetical protein